MPTALRSLGLTLAIAGIAGTIAGAAFMARRVAAYNAAVPTAEWEFKDFTNRTSDPFGHPLVITDGALPGGRAALNIRYGSDTLSLPVHPPKINPDPAVTANLSEDQLRARGLDLTLYDEWVKLVAFAPMEGGRIVESKDRAPRVVLVSRNAAPGADDQMGGLVNRKRWTFDVVEFLPTGKIAPVRRLQFRSTDYRTGEVYLPAERDDPASTVEPIEERSWEFQVALFAMPKLAVSNYRFKTDAVKGSNNTPGMGWTLPVTGFSVLAVVVGVALTAIGRASARERPRSNPPPT